MKNSNYSQDAWKDFGKSVLITGAIIGGFLGIMYLSVVIRNNKRERIIRDLEKNP